MRASNLGLASLCCLTLFVTAVEAESENVLLAESEGTDKIFSADEGGLDRLGEAARKHGWRVARDAEGNLLLFPGTGAAGQATETDVNQKIDSTNLDALQKALAERGWGTSRDDSDNLLLYPPGQAGKAPAKSVPIKEQPDVKAPDAGKTGEGDLDLLEKMLQTRGWGTSRDGAGNLLLYPATAEQQPVGFSAPVGSCRFGEVQLQMGNKVSLPIDQWAEALAIARAWLDYSGEAARIGKVREVNRLYLVSIVSDSAPHDLVTQLVIHSIDGRVIAIP